MFKFKIRRLFRSAVLTFHRVCWIIESIGLIIFEIFCALLCLLGLISKERMSNIVNWIVNKVYGGYEVANALCDWWLDETMGDIDKYIKTK